jgi:diguanylate cyclase (GGDEF)-like protein
VVLREIATLLSESVREIDLAGRWGGEEFALVLPGTDLGGGVGLAERIRRTLERRPIELGEALTVHVTVSFGVAAYSGVGDEADLVAAADEALYEAKRTGRNRVVAQPIAASQSEGSHFSS